MQKKAVAFTGHRPESLPFGRDMHSGRYDDFELILWKEIRRCMDEGYDTFYCGGARGVDIVCGEIVIAEKLSKHPDIRLVCAMRLMMDRSSPSTLHAAKSSPKR